jgi:hypothetical protein
MVKARTVPMAMIARSTSSKFIFLPCLATRIIVAFHRVW